MRGHTKQCGLFQQTISHLYLTDASTVMFHSTTSKQNSENYLISVNNTFLNIVGFFSGSTIKFSSISCLSYYLLQKKKKIQNAFRLNHPRYNTFLLLYFFLGHLTCCGLPCIYLYICICYQITNNLEGKSIYYFSISDSLAQDPVSLYLQKPLNQSPNSHCFLFLLWAFCLFVCLFNQPCHTSR